MAAQGEIIGKRAAKAPLTFLERELTTWGRDLHRGPPDAARVLQAIGSMDGVRLQAAFLDISPS